MLTVTSPGRKRERPETEYLDVILDGHGSDLKNGNDRRRGRRDRHSGVEPHEEGNSDEGEEIIRAANAFVTRRTGPCRGSDSPNNIPLTLSLSEPYRGSRNVNRVVGK